MTRTRATARQAGTAFETLIANHLATVIDDRIERRTLGGSRDRGDIAGVRLADGRRVVLECKDVSRLALSQWIAEAEAERVNDGAAIGLVIHKRRGKGNAGDQYVTLTVRDLVALLTGVRHA